MTASSVQTRPQVKTVASVAQARQKAPDKATLI